MRKEGIEWGTGEGVQSLVAANITSSLVLFASMMEEAIRWSLQEPHYITSQKTPFLMKNATHTIIDSFH
jgi:hypothetical protein